MASAGPPTLGLHLADPSHTPIVSSATLDTRSSADDFRALTDLTTTSLTAYASSSRLGLGLPRRILIETSKDGPVILHSFLNPQPPQPQAATDTNTLGPGNGNDNTDASTLLDQTREALQPMGGSTAEEETSTESTTAENISHSEEPENPTEDDDSLANGQHVVNRVHKGKGLQEEGQDGGGVEGVEPEQEIDSREELLAPLLVATVVSPSHSSEARRAIGKLERLGREFQRKWLQNQPIERVTTEEEETADG